MKDEPFEPLVLVVGLAAPEYKQCRQGNGNADAARLVHSWPSDQDGVTMVHDARLSQNHQENLR